MQLLFYSSVYYNVLFIKGILLNKNKQKFIAALSFLRAFKKTNKGYWNLVDFYFNLSTIIKFMFYLKIW